MGGRHHNGFKTMMLFAILWTLLLGIGWVISRAINNPIMILVFAGIGVFGTIYSYYNSASLALRSMNARPVSEMEQPAMYRIVRELSQAAGQPMPSLHVAPTETPNAFATGRNPENAAVCCTEGILRLLDERELRGVLGHELSHVYNRDILTSSVAAAIGGIITSAAQMMYWFGGMYRNDREGGNPIGMIGGLMMLILAPIASMFIQMAISRTREFDADQCGAELTKDPLALASALKKLELGTTQRPLPANPRTEKVGFMMIANPFKGSGLSHLFSTHPPMEERIRRLEAMAGY